MEIKIIKNGSLKGEKIEIEGKWNTLTIGSKSWMHCDGNPTCLIYAMRAAEDGLPIDDDVLYGKINDEGFLVHKSEI